MVPLIHSVLVFGFPLYALYKLDIHKPVRHAYVYSILSFASCCWAILTQLTTVKNRLFTGDIGGIEDTIQAVIIISFIILIIACIINLIMLILYYEK